MEQMLVDTSILVDILRGRRASILQGKDDDTDFAISVITYMELLQGSRNKAETAKIEKIREVFRLIHLDLRISEQSVSLIRQYSLSHRLQIPDALIAATSLMLNIPLLTLNQKDFHYISGLKLYDWHENDI